MMQSSPACVSNLNRWLLFFCPREENNDKPARILRFVNRKEKTELLKRGRNKHLTKQNTDIARKAWILKKQGKVQTMWTSSCKVFIMLNGTLEAAKVLLIRDMEELERQN